MGRRLLRPALRALALVIALACAPALAATILYVYDELGRLVVQLDSQGATLYSYDAAGNLVSVSRNSSDQLSVVSFSPTRAKIGDSVTILGTGFISDPTQNAVSFNGTPATVTSATATALVATVPVGVIDGPISVSNAKGSTASAQAFTLIVPPVISGVTPNGVSRGTTTRIQISGSHLASSRTVSFSEPGISARIVPGATEELLTVDLVVGGTVPFGTYSFSVTNEAGTTVSGSITIEVTAAVLGDALSATHPVSVHLPALIAGAPGGNAMSTTQSVSVHLQALIPGAPAGDAMSATQPVSVQLPAVIAGDPEGDAMSATEPVSVHLPALVPGVPSGDSMTVTEPVSVSVP